MATRADTTGLRNDIVVNGVRYALGRDVSRERAGLAWWREREAALQDIENGEVLTAEWPFMTPGGMGEIRRLSAQSLGYAFGERIDTSAFGFARLSELRFIKAPTTQTPTDVPTWFIEQGGAIFCYNGRYSWRMTVSGTTITISNDGTDLGAGAAAGRPAKFETFWYIPLGATVVFVELTTPSTNTYTSAAAGEYALAFTTIQDIITARLARAFGTNQVKLAATAPLVAANWGSAFEVGDSSTVITSIVETGVKLYVAKEDNLYLFDPRGTGFVEPVFNIGQGTGDTTNGRGLYAIPSTETAFYNHQSGLHLVDGNVVMLNVGPDGIRTNGEIPNVSLEPFRGRHYETVVFGDWVYTLYRVTEGASTRTYIMAGEMIGGPDRIMWHTMDIEANWARGLFIDSSQRLWTQVAGTFVVRQLGQNGAPNAGRGSNGRGAASTQHRIFLPATTFYRANGDPAPTVLKQLDRIETRHRNLAAAAPLQLTVYRDGGSAENVGTTITSGSQAARYPTEGTNDTFYELMLGLDITTTGGYTPASGDPQIHSVIVRAFARPDKGDLIHFIVDTSRPYGNGSRPIENPLQIRDALQALENGASVAVTAPDGSTLSLNVIKVTDLRMWTDEKGAEQYLLDVVGRQRVTA